MFRNAAVACFTSGIAIPQCNCLPSRRVATTPADLSMARCCDRLAFEMPSSSCNSEAQRSPRASISINCSRVGLAKALQITACRSKISCSPLDFRFVPTDAPESNEYLTSQASTRPPRAAPPANLTTGHRNHWLVISARPAPPSKYSPSPALCAKPVSQSNATGRHSHPCCMGSRTRHQLSNTVLDATNLYHIAPCRTTTGIRNSRWISKFRFRPLTNYRPTGSQVRIRFQVFGSMFPF